MAGSPVTGSKRTEGSDLAYKRTYKQGDLYSAVTGYSSQAYGSTCSKGCTAMCWTGPTTG